MQYLHVLLAVLSLSTVGHCRSFHNSKASIPGRKEAFLGATADLASSLKEVGHYTDLTNTDVLVEEILREAGKAQDIYFTQFTPAVGKLKSVLQSDSAEAVTAEEYSSEIVQELRDAVSTIHVTQDVILALILGEGNVMQQDGVRLGLSLRLLQRLAHRLDEVADTTEVSLSAVREVSAVADAAMEALQGVRRVAQHAQLDAEEILKGEKPSDSDETIEQEDEEGTKPSDNGETTEQENEGDEKEVSVEKSSEDQSTQSTPVRGFGSSENGITKQELEESKEEVNHYRGRRVRRRSLRLGGGFSLGGGGLLTYSGDDWSISATPTFSSYLPPRVGGFKISFRF